MDGYLDTCDTLDSRQFLIAVKRLADSFSYGTDRSPFLGAGIEYVQSRQYQWGDPIRSIDWRITARTGKLYVKEYEAPKRMPCYLLVDTSASMTISSVRRTKYSAAVHIAGGLALACLERVSPVGLVGAGDRSIRIDPSLSRRQVLEWLHRLRRFRYDESTMVGRRVAELSPSLRHRALVVVLSDLYDEQAIGALRQMAQRHDVVVLQMMDPAEGELRGTGFFRAREAESQTYFSTHGRACYRDPVAIGQELTRGRIDHLLVCTDQPYAHRVRHFFQSRNLLGRGAR